MLVVINHNPLARVHHQQLKFRHIHKINHLEQLPFVKFKHRSRVVNIQLYFPNHVAPVDYNRSLKLLRVVKELRVPIIAVLLVVGNRGLPEQRELHHIFAGRDPQHVVFLRINYLPQPVHKLFIKIRGLPDAEKRQLTPLYANALMALQHNFHVVHAEKIHLHLLQNIQR